MVIGGAKALPAKTGLGADNAETQIFKNAPSTASSKMAALLNDIEVKGTWLIQVLMAIVPLIGKPNGGDRPTTLAPMIFRLWSKTRRVLIAA